MEITGIIKSIGDVQNVTEKFKKREVVIETGFDTDYPQTILVEFQQDGVHKLDGKNVGQLAKVHFNLKGRQWTDKEGVVKTFNTLHGWKVENIGASDAATPSPAATATDPINNNNDDLPY